MLKDRKIQRILSLLVIWTLVMLPYYPAVAAKPDQDALKEQLKPATVSARSESTVKKTKQAAAQLLELAKMAGVEPQKRSTYIIRLEDPPVSNYKGGIQGLKPTSPLVTKQRKLNVTSSESLAYLSHLDLKRETVVKNINQVTGRQPKIVHEYRLAMNGMAIELTLDEAEAVAGLPGVSQVIPDWTEHIQTDAGPAWMGADTIWDGSATGTSTRGEGIVVGILDTGINMDHPSFADIGGDGYDHTNPFGTGNYFGWCNPADPNYDPSLPCNDKLIGAWSGDADGPEDCAGHGSHTASTVAGNVILQPDVIINAPTISHNLANQISGVAPHANIIAYNIEATPCSGSASGAVIIAATEQAIADQVDVINYSFGAGGADPWAFAEHWYNVRAAGIFVATSAGNDGSGPDTIGSPGNAPWMMTVGASSHDRMFSNALINLSGGDTPPPADIEGEGLTSALTPAAPLIYAGDVAVGNEGCDAEFAPGLVTGSIVVCDYYSTVESYDGRVNKSISVANSGGVGFILINRQDWATALMVDSYAVPGLGIPYDEGEALKTWLSSGTGHQGEIRGVLEEPARGDIIAGFSSRGPNGPLPDVIKPDVTAPGRRIVAAIATDQSNPNPPEFDVYQGTSMSSPHAAGAAALIRALHPTWTPAEVQSALMTTTNDTNVLKEDAATLADPFDMGAGRIDLLTAANAALLLDETPENMWAANPNEGGDPTALNLASLGDSRCVGSCSWTRTVRATTAGTWNATVNAPAGVTLTVTPGTFSLASGATQEVTIDMDVTGMPVDEWIFGSVVLTPTASGVPATHFPVAVRPSNGSVPDQMSIRTRRNAGSQILEDVEAIEITNLTIEVDGMIPATLDTRDLVQDSDRSTPYDDPTDGAFYVNVSVPSGASTLVAEIIDSEAPDIDLFVGTGTIPSEATEACRSTTGSWQEVCQIADPAAGDWWILVQNWAESATPPDSVTLAYGVIEDGDLGNMTVSGLSSVPAGQLFDLTVFWDEPAMAAGDRWYGTFSIGTDSSSPGNIGSVFVALDRLEDDVSKTVDSFLVVPGDTLTYQITIQPNVTPADLVYTLTDTIPDGLTYVPGSATATSGTVEVTGNTLSWTGTMLSPVGLTGNYVVTTNATDPMCDTGFGGYVDLENTGPGFLPDPGAFGDSKIWTYIGSITDDVPIQFYGLNKTAINVTDDGFIFFDSTSGDEPWTNTDLPNPNDPNDLLAAFWNDMEVVYDGTPGSVRGITVVYISELLTIIEYDDVEPWPAGSGSDRYDFEAVIYNEVDDSPGAYEIVFAYGPQTGSPASATIGVENADGTVAAKYLYGDPSSEIYDGLMVCFDYQVPTLAPVVITYQVTVDSDAFGILTNNVVHTTDNPGSQEASTSVDVEVDVPWPTPTPGPGAIPEPTSIVLFGLGLLGVIALLARRKRK